LKSLKINLQTTFDLAKRLPKETRGELLLVSESGINSPEDIKRLADAGWMRC